MSLMVSRATFFFLTYFIANIINVSAQTQNLPELGKGQSIQEILKIVADKNQPTPAKVGVSLKNGIKFEGIVSSFTKLKNTLSLKNDGGTVTLIDLYSIASVTILDPGSALNALRGNKIFREEKSTIPSRLALLRRVDAFNAANLVDIKLELVPAELSQEDCRFYTSRVFDEVELVLNEAGADKLGSEAIGKLKNGFSIAHKPDSELSIIGSKDTLVLSFDCEAPLNSNFGETIATSVNELL